MTVEGKSLTASTFKKLWKNEYIQTAIMILLILAVVLGFWYGSRLVLNTEYPALAVASGSMCKVQHMNCDGWSHPFDRTLHVGDLIIVQGVNVSDIHAAPEPEGDIIVYQQEGTGDLIVHRAIEKQVEDGQIYFITKGDANSSPDRPVPADHVIGKVLFRIPWIGHLALLMRDSSGIYIIIALIAILIVVELLIPIFKSEKPKTERNEDVSKTSETDSKHE
jgi:signal peptidase I